MFVLVNLKAYACDPLEVARAARDVTENSEATVAVAPQAAHLNAVSETGAETWSQHLSPVEPGSHTGSTLAEAISTAGGVGTLINHSEQRMKLADIEDSVKAARRVGLETIVCGNTPEQVGAAAALGPDAVAVEPPELIGTGTPVSQADPDIVTDAIDAVDNVDDSVMTLCGAGISSGEDLVSALELGADGVLLASGVAKAGDPRRALEELVAPLS